jgi:hypothetical protein
LPIKDFDGKSDQVGGSNEQISRLRESIRRAFPAETYVGNVTQYDDELSSELREDQAILDEEQDLFRALKGRKWTEVPKELLENLPSGYGLLSGEAFVAFLPAWLSRALDDMDVENEVRNFLVYGFDTMTILGQLRLLSPEQRSVVRSLLVEFCERGTAPFVRALAVKALALIDKLG